MLDETLGPQRAVARVAIDMNFDSTSTESKSYAPQGTTRSEQIERESYNGTGSESPPAAGVPGTTTQRIGTYQGLQTGTERPLQQAKIDDQLRHFRIEHQAHRRAG